MTDSLHQHTHQESSVLFEFKNVTIKYGKETIINNLSMKIKSNSFVSILGINGSGKTTLIKAIMGLVPYEGVIYFNNQDIKSYSKKLLAKLIAYVPQLFANKGEVTVYDYVAFGRFPYSGSFFLTKKDKKIIEEVLKNLKIWQLRSKFLNQISGGQRQKVALASALAQHTDVIILDEPTTYLDLKSQFEILEIAHLLHLKGKTIIVVLHDLNQAIKYSDNVALIHQHKLFGIDNPHKLLTIENIKKIYGVNVIMQKREKHNYIIDVDAKSIMEDLKWY